MNAELRRAPDAEFWTRWEHQIVGGEFPLRRLLGCSQDSAVFLTEFKGKGVQNAAIKFVRADESQAKVWLAQWKVAAPLSHPHLVHLFGMGQYRFEGHEFVFVVMEHADQTLAEILQRRPLSAEEVRELLIPTLDALTFLHRRNRVHGALKPSNLLAVDDQLKLASDTVRPTTQGDGGIAAAEDVWRLGVTLVEALTQRSWSGPPDLLLEQILPSDVPEELVETIRQCLRPAPGDRPSVIELRSQYKASPEPSPSDAASAARPPTPSANVPSAITPAPRAASPTPREVITPALAREASPPSPATASILRQVTTPPSGPARAAAPPAPAVVPRQTAPTSPSADRGPAPSPYIERRPSPSSPSPSIERRPSPSSPTVASATPIEATPSRTPAVAREAMRLGPAIERGITPSPAIAQGSATSPAAERRSAPPPSSAVASAASIETVPSRTPAVAREAIRPAPAIERGITPSPAIAQGSATSPAIERGSAPPSPAIERRPTPSSPAVASAPPIEAAPAQAKPEELQKQSRSLVLSIIAVVVSVLGIAAWLNLRTPNETPVADSKPVAAPLPVPEDETPEPAPAPTRVTPQPKQTQTTDPQIVLHEVLPTVPAKIQSKIQGRVYVTVRVLVDPTGNVVGVLMENPGPSKYFARLSERAAHEWQFAPADIENSRVWLVRFLYTRDDVSAKTFEQ